MNNKGQTLVLFIIILPVLFMLLALIVDIGFLYNEKNKLNSIVIENIKYFLSVTTEDEEDKLTRLLYKNIDDVVIEKVSVNDNVIKVKIRKEYKGIFATILSQKINQINVSYVGYKKDSRIIIEKE